MSRFWTQFEAWLSLQLASPTGLHGDPAARRCVVACIHNAPTLFAELIQRMWTAKDVDAARDTLAQPDVTVTNQSDKTLQLHKLEVLNQSVKQCCAQLGIDPPVKSSEPPLEVPLRVASASSLQEGHLAPVEGAATGKAGISSSSACAVM